MEFDVCCPRDIQAVAIVDAELWLLQNAVDRAPFLAGFRGTPFLEPLRTLVHCKPTIRLGAQGAGHALRHRCQRPLAAGEASQHRRR